MWSVQIKDVEAIDIESTTFCNLHCPECNRETDIGNLIRVLNTVHLTAEDIRNWIRPDELTNLTEIRFCGAIDESAANPHLFDIINYFNDSFVRHNKMFFIDIRTNGSLKTTSWWKQLAQTLPSNHSVSFGIDGSDELSEKYRVGSSFKKVINNATAFIEAGGLADWQFIEFEHNKHQVEEAQQKARDLGFKSFNVMTSSRDDMSGEIEHVTKQDVEPVQSFKGTKNPNKDYSATRKNKKDDKKQHKLLGDEKGKVIHKHGAKLLTKKAYTEKIKITCENQTVMGNRILINSLGYVTPCCFLNGYIHFPHDWDIRVSQEPHLPEFQFFEDLPLNEIYLKHGLKSISLHHNTLKEILAGEFWEDIEDSWKSDNPINRCHNVCGKMITDETKILAHWDDHTTR